MRRAYLYHKVYGKTHGPGDSLNAAEEAWLGLYHALGPHRKKEVLSALQTASQIQGVLNNKDLVSYVLNDFDCRPGLPGNP